MPITTLKELLIAHLGTRYVKSGQGARSTFFGIDIMQDVDGHYIYEFVVGGGRFKSAHEDWSPITYSVVQGLVEQAESTHPTPPPARRWVTCSEGVSDGQLGGTDSWEELGMCMQPCVFFPVSSS